MNVRAITERTPVSIALVITLCGALTTVVFAAGYYKSKIDGLEEVPKQISMIREDLVAIKHALGIPNRSTVSHTVQAPAKRLPSWGDR